MAITYLNTGQTRTLTFSKTISASAYVDYIDNTVSPNQISATDPDGWLKWFYAGAANPSQYIMGECTVGTQQTQGSTSLTITIQTVSKATVNGTTVTGTANFGSVTLPGNPAPITKVNLATPPIIGTIDISMPGIEAWVMYYNYRDVYGPGGTSFPNSAYHMLGTSPYITVDGRDFPDYSTDYPANCNAGEADGLNACGAFYYEMCPAGTVATVTVNTNGAVATNNYTFGSQFLIDYLVEDYSGAGCTASGGLSQTCSLSSQAYTGSTLVAEGATSESYSGGYATSSVSNVGGININTATGSNPASPVSYGSQAWLNQAVTSPITYSLNPSIQYFESTGSATVDYQSNYNGAIPGPVLKQTTGSATFGQRRGGGTWQCGPNSGNLPTYTEWLPVRAFLDKVTTAASGDDATDWRCQFAGLPFTSFTLSLAASTAVLGSQTQNTSSVIYTPTVLDWEGYRYLSFTADQDGSLMVTTPQSLTKTWSWAVTTPGTAQTITLDLKAPTAWNQDSSTMPDVDERMSRYPLGTGGHPDEINQGSSTDSNGYLHDKKGAYWGVFEISNLTIDIASSTTLHLGAMSLVNQTSSDISCLANFYPAYVDDQQGSALQVDQIQTILRSDNRVIDFPALYHQPSTLWADYTLAGMISFINGLPGWTATASGSFPDSYHTNSGPAEWLGGNGMTFSATALSTSWWQHALGNIIAQELLDEISLFPGAGNIHMGGAYAGTSALCFAKYLRGRAAGVVQKKGSGLPLTGAPITTTPPSGSATAAADGYYQTGSPFGHGNTSITVEQTNNLAGAASTWQNREVVYRSFRSILIGSSPYMVADNWGGMHAVQIDSDGDIQYYYCSFTGLAWINSGTVTSGGGWSNPRMCIASDRRIEMRAIYTDTHGNKDAYSAFSYDYGKTFSFSGVPSMASAVLADVKCSPGGTLLEINAVPTSGTSGPGTFSGRIKHSGDATFGSAFTLNDSTGAALNHDGSGFGFDAEKAMYDRWLLRFVVNGQTSPTSWWSGDSGATWTQLN